MIQVICAVRDSAINAFMRPFFAATVGAAVRAFTDEVNRQGSPSDSPMYNHASDYELFELGSFLDATGVLEVLHQPRSVCRAVDVLKEAP